MISDFLLDHFLEWQKRLGERKSLKDFADYIGISDKLLNHYMTGRRTPSQETVVLIYQALGDEKIFEITNTEKPDMRLAFIQRNWINFDEAQKAKVMEMFSNYQTKKRAVNEPNTTPKQKPAHP